MIRSPKRAVVLLCASPAHQCLAHLQVLSRLPFWQTGPRPQLVMSLIQRLCKGRAPLLVSPVTATPLKLVGPPSPTRSKGRRQVLPAVCCKWWGLAPGPCCRQVSPPIHERVDVSVTDSGFGLLHWSRGWARTGPAGLRGAAQRHMNHLFFIFLLFRAVPMAYRSSQARGGIRAAAACVHHSHSNGGPELHLQATPELEATPDP